MNSDWLPTLKDDRVILTPLKDSDFEALFQVAADPLIWEQHPVKDRCQRIGFEKFFKESLASGGALLIKDLQSSEVIGSSRFNQFPDIFDKIEIGWTFLARKFWGGNYNKAVKKLMIDYALNLGSEVILFVAEDNFRSQKAVEKLGAERVLHPEKENIPDPGKTEFTFRINKAIWKF